MNFLADLVDDCGEFLLFMFVLILIVIVTGCTNYSQQNDFNKKAANVNSLTSSYFQKIEETGMLTEFNKAELQHKIRDLGLDAKISGTTKRALPGENVYLDVKLINSSQENDNVDIFKAGKAY